MNIFILNRGSSSIKCFLYRFKDAPQSVEDPVWEAHIQWKNVFDSPVLSIKTRGRESYSEVLKEKDAAHALRALLTFLVEGKTEEIAVIGHRIVHGGRDFTGSVRVTEEVKEKIRQLSHLAPLHNLPELEGIELLEQFFPEAIQVAVFDTAFHHTIPQAAKVYPGPYQWYEEGIQRYGFHGISFQYCSRRAGEILQCDAKSLKMVICHLGAGASLCAVNEGKSIDTTMGFTPLEGLMMDTRSGSIDPGIIFHLLEKKKKSVEELSDELYTVSGLLGLSGISSDMRDIIEKGMEGDTRALLAFEVYVHRLSACIGSMIASLQGIDVLIFTAGIGENASLLRKKVCAVFSFLGLSFDHVQNERQHQEDALLSTPSSSVRVLVIHTQEAFEIACECVKIVKI